MTGIKSWSYPQNQMDKQFDFRYVDHVLEKTNNKRGARWAKRKNIHVISICLINNGKSPIHGSQLAFYEGDQKVELMHNLWLARKVRQRTSPLMILALPAFLIEDALFHRHDDEYEENCNSMFAPDQDDTYITNEIVDQEFQKQNKANFSLAKELMNFQLANQILYPGKSVYGVIGIKCKGEIKHLQVMAKNADFQILSVSK